VTTREEEKDVLDAQDILSLQQRDFFMLTYSGRYKGKTLPTTDSKMEIIFPSANTTRGGEKK
jgi:hypothetical protein